MISRINSVIGWNAIQNIMKNQNLKFAYTTFWTMLYICTVTWWCRFVNFKSETARILFEEEEEEEEWNDWKIEMDSVRHFEKRFMYMYNIDVETIFDECAIESKDRYKQIIRENFGRSGRLRGVVLGMFCNSKSSWTVHAGFTSWLISKSKITTTSQASLVCDGRQSAPVFKNRFKKDDPG